MTWKRWRLSRWNLTTGERLDEPEQAFWTWNGAHKERVRLNHMLRTRYVPERYKIERRK